MVMARKRLLELRGEKSRKEIAAMLGITPQGLGMIERGQRTPSLATAKKIADFYGVAVEDIFFDRSRHVSFPEKATDHPPDQIPAASPWL